MVLPNALSQLIDFFEALPGIGPKTAQRLAFYLLRTPPSFRAQFGKLIGGLEDNVQLCQTCYNISDSSLCQICRDASRQRDLLCVVEEPLDLIAVESSGFSGLYHVLGGALSPLNNVGPDDLRIAELLKRVEGGSFSEIILATNPTIEGEATAMYVREKLKKIAPGCRVTRLGRGLPVGGDVEFCDSQTLARSLEGRRDY